MTVTGLGAVVLSVGGAAAALLVFLSGCGRAD